MQNYYLQCNENIGQQKQLQQGTDGKKTAAAAQNRIPTRSVSKFVYVYYNTVNKLYTHTQTHLHKHMYACIHLI